MPVEYTDAVSRVLGRPDQDVLLLQPHRAHAGSELAPQHHPHLQGRVRTHLAADAVPRATRTASSSSATAARPTAHRATLGSPTSAVTAARATATRSPRSPASDTAHRLRWRRHPWPGEATTPRRSAARSSPTRTTSTLPGVFGVYPIEGVIVWNSHAFNLFEVPVTNEQWWNVYFAPAEDRQILVRNIFDSTRHLRAERAALRGAASTAGRSPSRSVRASSSSARTRTSAGASSASGVRRTSRYASCNSTTANPEACTAEPDGAVLHHYGVQRPDGAQSQRQSVGTRRSRPGGAPVQVLLDLRQRQEQPLEVKRNSTSPIPPQFGNLAPGGKCYYDGFGGTIDNGISCLNGPRRASDASPRGSGTAITASATARPARVTASAMPVRSPAA